MDVLPDGLPVVVVTGMHRSLHGVYEHGAGVVLVVVVLEVVVLVVVVVVVLEVVVLEHPPCAGFQTKPFTPNPTVNRHSP